MLRNLFERFFKTVLAVSILFVALPLSAQAQYSVKLKLIDDKTGEPVAFATASLTPKGATTATKYVLTDDKGQASITKVAKGEYSIKAEIMGYKTYTHELTVDKNINLGDIRMEEDAVALDAAKVSAVGNPITIKKDTIEYNASSFKTSDNDMLEQLLKKLPGVEVEADGSITANGETIKKITIDGKTFFLDDPQLASKNIPAKIIDKVKVVEKKSDQAMFTGIDDGEEETIIDLKLRPGMAEGWFGNVMGGGGHDVPGAGSDMKDWRYQGAAMIGRFTDKSQLSIILNGNNTNNRGFNDVAGGMMQEMGAFNLTVRLPCHSPRFMIVTAEIMPALFNVVQISAACHIGNFHHPVTILYSFPLFSLFKPLHCLAPLFRCQLCHVISPFH